MWSAAAQQATVGLSSPLHPISGHGEKDNRGLIKTKRKDKANHNIEPSQATHTASPSRCLEHRVRVNI